MSLRTAALSRMPKLCLALLALAVGGRADTEQTLKPLADNKQPTALTNAPIRALLLGHSHADVTAQLLAESFAKNCSVAFDIRSDWQAVLRKPDFDKGYDVIVYFICDPECRDRELIDSALQATRNGKGTVLIHGTLHTFRHVPAWTELLGVRTITHDGYRELNIKKAGKDHPVTKALPDSWQTPGDELYAHEYVVKGVTPLLTAYSVQHTNDNVVAWAHTYGQGRVFGTSLGHDLKTLDTVPFQLLLARGLEWAAGRERPQ